MIRFILLFLISLNLYAQSSEVQHNVTVMQNSTPQACANYTGGEGGAENVESFSRFGETTELNTVGIQTCSDCALDAKQNCICQTCYNHFN